VDWSIYLKTMSIIPWIDNTFLISKIILNMVYTILHNFLTPKNVWGLKSLRNFFFFSSFRLPVDFLEYRKWYQSIFWHAYYLVPKELQCLFEPFCLTTTLATAHCHETVMKFVINMGIDIYCNHGWLSI